MAALTRLYKCFGHSQSRKAYLLDPQKILGNEPGGMDAFNHYKAERNKHVVHDENAFSQAFIGAAINDGTHSHKVERVISLACDMQLFTEENWRNLRLLTSKTLEFVIAETERLSAEVKADLEQESYEALAAREPITYKSPVGTNPLKRRDQSHLN
ncbi:hypothetical protein ACDW_43500 (plasmid) [Acidovorax sp. DW039]|uniref:hypothetical protein n=1 Tax=Acidovorax sp. DW039 TaxID=3095606 RepID=UPI003087AFAD|nr:hypothetical protein ACDW_43500 [Acidovorax sp. DW039]